MTIKFVKNKIITFIGWSWNYFSYRQSLRLLIKRNKRQHDERTINEDCKFHDVHSSEQGLRTNY